MGPFRKGANPRQERLRPLVLPRGMVEGERSGGRWTLGPGLSGNVGVRGAVGIGDRFQLTVGTGVALTPDFAWNQTVEVEVAVLAVDGKRFDMAPGLSIPLTFADGSGLQVAVHRWTEHWFYDDVDTTARIDGSQPHTDEEAARPRHLVRVDDATPD